MKRFFMIAAILSLGLLPLACQKTYTLGPLSPGSGTQTATATPTLTPNATCPVGNHTYLAQFGAGLGTGNGQFTASFPSAVAVDAAGNVYTCDTNRIEVFSPGGAFLSKWTTGVGGTAIYPWDIAIDASGNVYVIDQAQNFLDKFTSAGVYVTQTAICTAHGIAVDSAGNVYVACISSCAIIVFNSSLAYLATWGSCGSGNGQLNNPAGIAIDASGNVFVADNLNSRIEKFTTAGGYISQWGTAGAGPGQFNHPLGLALSGCGNLFVVDHGNSRIQEFDSNGTYLSQWGSLGSGNYQFVPYGVAVDSNRNIYVADVHNDLVKEYGP